MSKSRKSGKSTRRSTPPKVSLPALMKRFSQAWADGDFLAASAATELALRQVPLHPQILADHALSLMRSGQYERAYRAYTTLLKLPPTRQQLAPADWLDGLAELCGWMGKLDELRRYGLLALARADERFATPTVPPPGPPPPFDARQPQRNVISYSLFGAQPRYCEAMLMNARLTVELFPGWTCRVYLDDSVPLAVRDDLRAAGAEVMEMDAVRRHSLPAVTWRFLVMDDPGVDRFLVRDADALLSEREEAAVAQWLASTTWFHHMRDYFTHTELLLAGLWGGCNGWIQGTEASIAAYARQHQGRVRYVDQHYLRQVVWPYARQSLLSHDELFGFHGGQPFPTHRPVRWSAANFHVGSNASYQQITGASELADGQYQCVQLSAIGDRPRQYRAAVRAGKWCLDLPFFLVEALAQQRMSVQIVGSEDR